jgi:hypothetical protein
MFDDIQKVCSSITELTFESPSRLEQLELSIPGDFAGGEIQVPDSVIWGNIQVGKDWPGHLVVEFGRDSRIRSAINRINESPGAVGQMFSRFSERTLKKFRGIAD